MICEQGVEGALPPLGNAVPKPLLVFLMTDLGLLHNLKAEKDVALVKNILTHATNKAFDTAVLVSEERIIRLKTHSLSIDLICDLS
jgi:hypothetical protein